MDIEIKVKVTEYQTAEYRSRITGTRGHAPFPSGIRNEVSYGDGVKALAFLLNNYCNVSIDKTQQLIKELKDGCICMSKGMINHLCREFSEKSSEERKDLFDRLVKAPVLYSDATGCRINGKGSFVVICATPKEMQYYHRENKGHAGIKGTPVEENRLQFIPPPEEKGEFLQWYVKYIPPPNRFIHNTRYALPPRRVNSQLLLYDFARPAFCISLKTKKRFMT